MENILPLAVPVTPVLSYPTIKESWGALGWFLLCTIAVAIVVLVPAGLVHYQSAQAKPLTTALAGEGGLLLTIWWLRRRAGPIRWPRSVRQRSGASWSLYAMLLVLVPAQALLLTTLSLLPLPNWMEKTFTGWSRYPVLAFGIGSLVAPVLEEYLFRGILLRGLLRNYRPWVAIGQSALLFGVFHFNPAQSVSAALLGLLLGWLYYRTQSLGLCIGLHALNNSFAFMMLRLDAASHDTALKVGTPTYWLGVGIAAVIISACLWWVGQQPKVPIENALLPETPPDF